MPISCWSIFVTRVTTNPNTSGCEYRRYVLCPSITHLIQCHIHLPVCLSLMDSHTESQQSSREKYKPWKWGGTARYYASHAKTMLPKRKSVPRSNRQSDHTNTSCIGMVMSPVYQVWPKPSCKAQWMGEEDKTDSGKGGKTTSGDGQAWSSPSPRGQWRMGKKKKKGGNWLWNHLWCPNDTRG